MRRLHAFVAISSLLLTLTGCGQFSGQRKSGKEEGTGTADKKPEIVKPDGDEQVPAELSGADNAKKLIGYWSNCESTIVGDAPMYRKKTMSFEADGSMTIASSLFDDENCLQKKTEFFLPEIERLLELRIAMLRLIGGTDEKTVEEEISESEAKVAALYTSLANGKVYYGTFVAGDKTRDAHYALDLLLTGEPSTSRFTSYVLVEDLLNISKTCIQDDIDDQVCYSLMGQDSENRSQSTALQTYRRATTNGLEYIKL